MHLDGKRRKTAGGREMVRVHHLIWQARDQRASDSSQSSTKEQHECGCGDHPLSTTLILVRSVGAAITRRLPLAKKKSRTRNERKKPRKEKKKRNKMRWREPRKINQKVPRLCSVFRMAFFSLLSSKAAPIPYTWSARQSHPKNQHNRPSPSCEPI